MHTWDPPIFHRDMKSLNLLINKDWQVKICDMGLARFNTENNLQSMSKICGTYAYLAPEMFYGRPFTAKTDVFACGVVLNEIAVRLVNGKYEVPYQELKLKLDFQILFQVAEKNARPRIPDKCPPPWSSLVNRCWEKEPNNRPNISQLLTQLKEMQQDFIKNSAELWNSTVSRR